MSERKKYLILIIIIGVIGIAIYCVTRKKNNPLDEEFSSSRMFKGASHAPVIRPSVPIIPPVTTQVTHYRDPIRPPDVSGPATTPYGLYEYEIPEYRGMGMNYALENDVKETFDAGPAYPDAPSFSNGQGPDSVYAPTDKILYTPYPREPDPASGYGNTWYQRGDTLLFYGDIGRNENNSWAFGTWPNGRQRGYERSGVQMMNGMKRPLAVPIPSGTLKESNDRYLTKASHPRKGIYGPENYDNHENYQIALDDPLLTSTGTIPLTPPNYPLPFQQNTRPLSSSDFLKPYGPNPPGSRTNFGFATPSSAVGSSDSYAPLPEVLTSWEKIGVLSSTTGGKDRLVNLYRRPIAPLQDLWEYSVQDKDGFILRLANTKYLENGDIIDEIPGKPNQGPWKCDIFLNNKWVWV